MIAACRIPQRLVRCFHSSFPRLSSAPRRCETYPYPLWYHPEKNAHVQALSFLGPDELAGKSLKTEAVIGWVKDDVPTPELKPANFQPNPPFEDLLHDVISKNIEGDEGFRALAMQQKMGHLNINDERVYTPWGRVSDPEDILGGVQLHEGKIVPGTYERMPTHRLVSSNGLFRLSDFLHSNLVDRLRRVQ